MFALPDPMSHVSSAAFARARLRPGSSSAQGLLALFTLRDTAQPNQPHHNRNSQLLTRGPKRTLSQPGILNMLLLHYTNKYRDYNLGRVMLYAAT
jgi:hypothetical protein